MITMITPSSGGAALHVEHMGWVRWWGTKDTGGVCVAVSVESVRGEMTHP